MSKNATPYVPTFTVKYEAIVNSITCMIDLALINHKLNEPEADAIIVR